MSDVHDKNLQNDSQLNKLLQNPPQLDPQHIEKNLKLPLQMCQQGRELLKKQQYLLASKSFSKSVMSYEYLLKNGLMTKQQTKQMFLQIMIPSYSNLALCYLKIGSYESVISFCNQILNHDNSHVKSKYRRGQAYHKLRKYDEAIEDFRSVIQLDPTLTSQCEALIMQCRKDIADEKIKTKKIASAFISNLSDPRSSSGTKGDNGKDGKIVANIKKIYKKIWKCFYWVVCLWKKWIKKQKQI